MMSVCSLPYPTAARWILAVCWSVFAIVWFIGALYNRRYSGKIERRGSWSWILGAAVWAAVFWGVPQSVWRPVVFCQPWIQWIGAAVLLAATAFTVWARAVLGLMWSSMPAKRTGHELRTNGPYRVTRHPIYTGLIGMLLGTGLIDHGGPWIVVVPFAAIMLMFKLREEELLMREAFGDAYLAYRKRVPGLLPWPRPNR